MGGKGTGMKKLYQKDPLWFAVIWIVIYVVGFSAADSVSESIGMPKLITVILGAALSIMLVCFILSQGLMEHVGLCGVKGKAKDLAYFIPLIVISSVNLWCGIRANYPAITALLSVISMCFVGFLEEVIFRGLLFKAMSRDGIRTAVIVSSLTFGFGHIVNLLLGAPIPLLWQHFALHNIPCRSQFPQRICIRTFKYSAGYYCCRSDCYQRSIRNMAAEKG